MTEEWAHVNVNQFVFAVLYIVNLICQSGLHLKTVELYSRRGKKQNIFLFYRSFTVNTIIKKIAQKSHGCWIACHTEILFYFIVFIIIFCPIFSLWCFCIIDNVIEFRPKSALDIDSKEAIFLLRYFKSLSFIFIYISLWTHNHS